MVKFYSIREEHMKRPIYLYNSFEKTGVISQYTLVYDQERGHIEKAKSHPPTVFQNLFTSDYYIIKRLDSGEVIVIRTWAKEARIQMEVSEEKDIHFIFFDFECVSDAYKDFHQTPYSASWCIANFELLKELENIENDFSQEKLENFKLRNCKTSISYNCINDMLNSINNVLNNLDRPQSRFILVGFNNSRYDNFMLLDALKNFKTILGKGEIIESVEMHGKNVIGKLQFFGGKCDVFDLNRHITGSLAKLCKDFGFKHIVKMPELIDHKVAQILYHKHAGVSIEENSGRTRDLESFKALMRLQASKKWSKSHPDNDTFFQKIDETFGIENLKKYNEFDVLSTALLAYKYFTLMNEFDSVSEVSDLTTKMKAKSKKKYFNPSKLLAPIYYHCSLPSFMYKVCMLHAKNLNGLDIVSPSLEQYKVIKKSVIAGRVETFSKNNTKFEGRIMSLDIVSSYPYSMFVLPVDFPVGKCEESYLNRRSIDILNNYYAIHKKFQHFGWYFVDIDQSILKETGKPLIIAQRTEDGRLIWEYEENSIIQHNIPISNVDIEQLLKYGCKVEFKLNSKCYEWKSRCRNFELFGFMKDAMAVKNNEDKKNREKDPTYNPSMRALAKFIAVSLSGKFVQKVIHNRIRVVKIRASQSKLTRVRSQIPNTEKEITAISDKLHMEEWTAKDEEIKNIKPIHIGSLIYSYSRARAYDCLLYPLGYEKCIYHDTDSVKFLASDFHLIEEFLKTTPTPHNIELEDVDENYKNQKVLFDKDDATKVFGCFEDELPKTNNLTFINARKEWGSFTVLEDGSCDQKASHCKLKGLNVHSIKININGLEEMGFIATWKDKSIVIDNNRAVEYCLEHKNNVFSNKDIAKQTFEELNQGNNVYFLISPFRKDIATRSVTVKYLVKCIRPGDKKGLTKKKENNKRTLEDLENDDIVSEDDEDLESHRSFFDDDDMDGNDNDGCDDLDDL